MALQSIKVRHKGQITLPANLRKELDIDEGDDLFIQRRGKELVIVLPADVVDPTAGALAAYAYTNNPDPAEERRWVAQHIAETADIYDHD
jgi:AbrB family looped-hinge helix DNA binding protein